ncbi:unnamed protein product [Calypogeia fissa]
MAWNHTFRRRGGVNSALFEEIAGWLEGVRIRRSLLLPSGVMEVSLIFFTICMNMLASSYAQSGFLSIDCGSTQTNYTDSFGLKWVTDSGKYMTTGTSFQQSSVNWTFLNSTAGAGMQAWQSFRYFPDRRSKYCYELQTEPNSSYLVRASLYMSEEELTKRAPFQFFTYLNGTQWFTLSSPGTQPTNPDINDLFVTQEAIFSTPGQVMYFCLQPVVGVPFISSLELRQLAPTMYSYSGNQLQYLSLLFRYNLGPQSTTPELVRFPADVYDRVWKTIPTLSEAYAQYNFNFSQTIAIYDDIIRALKRNLSLTDWQGDPCVPVPYDGLTCSCYLCEEGKGTLFSEYAVDSLTLANLSKSELSFLNNGFSIDILTSLSITSSGIDNLNFGAILLSSLFSLTYLDFSYNAIESIPAPLSGDFVQSPLVFMNFSNNQITVLDIFENTSFSFLNNLNLSHNDIISLPNIWSNGTNNLTVLDLSHNQLAGDISSLDNIIQINSQTLQELYVSNNKLHGTFSSSLYFQNFQSLELRVLMTMQFKVL